MSLVEGDIHGKPERFSSDLFKEGKELTKDDYVIILGDFGLIWDYQGENKNEKYWLDWLNDKPWTTLFIDGNHCNFDRLNSYEVSEWHGGKVHFIRPSVIHLMRGEIFNIGGKKILAMGGAESHDTQQGIIDPADYPTRKDMRKACRELEEKCGGWQFAMYRIRGESWWPQEVPSAAERENAIINLEKNNNKVDFILSHEAPASDLSLLSHGCYKPTEYSKFLETIHSTIDYKGYFFGHYHIDKIINEKDMCLYHNIIRIS